MLGKNDYPFVGLGFFAQLLGENGIQLLVKTFAQQVLGNFYPISWLFSIYPTLGKMLGKKLPNSVAVYLHILQSV
jgi:hypothetical protein